MAPLCPPDAPTDSQPADALPADGPNFNFKAKKKWPHRASHKASKYQLLHRSQLDQRLGAVQTFDAYAKAVHTDLGGRDRLSAVELSLVEAYTGASLVLANLNSKIGRSAGL
jgi:hypothetical protein